ncbi:MAG TPA: phosphatase PAP2 family protein, partial [Bacillota bacterium]|nr:phosphatase PAP2 family protein [Bacillota bacterium]
MQFELEMIHWFQDLRNGFLDFLFNFFTVFGEELVLIVILGFIYWSYDKKVGEKMGFTIFISLAFNSLLKLVIHRPRPFVADSTIEPLRLDTAGGYSFPSGHTQTAATTFFSLYYNIKKRWLLIVAIVITILVAISRMYLGVHYLTDVLVGAALGITIAWIFGKYFDRIKKIDLVYSVILALVVLSGVIILVVNYLSNTSAGVIDAAQFYFDSEAVMKMLGTISGFIMAIKY